MNSKMSCTLLALIFSICLLSPIPSYAEETGGWKFLKWGMSPQEVRQAAKTNHMEFTYEEDEFKRMEQRDLRDRKRDGMDVYYDEKHFVNAPGLTVIKGTIGIPGKSQSRLFFFNDQLFAAYTNISFSRYLDEQSVIIEYLKEQYPKGKVYKQKLAIGSVNCFKYDTKSQRVFTLVVQSSYFLYGGIWYVNPQAIGPLNKMAAEVKHAEAQAKRKKIKSSY